MGDRDPGRLFLHMYKNRRWQPAAPGRPAREHRSGVPRTVYRGGASRTTRRRHRDRGAAQGHRAHRARLAPYERPLAHAAIDAGANIVIGHHAHIIRGIELYRGAPIFHGLGNGCVVTRALSPAQSDPKRAAWAKRRRELFGFEPDPAYELAPFHPEAVHAMLGRVVIDEHGMRVGFIPVYVEPPGRPRIAFDHAERIARYVSEITVEAGLPPLSLNITSEAVWLN